jgi:glutamine synthetase
MTGEGEAFLAGVLAEIAALTAVLAPSVASHARLVPSRWAGAYRCWGRENREAVLRLVTGSAGEAEVAANAEVKCIDASANPYLAVGAVLEAGLAGCDQGLSLPDEVLGDPAELTPEELRRLGVERLPETVEAALACLDKFDLLKEAMGDYLYDAFTAVRRAECALFADHTADQVVSATRWRY